ncbi:hypothetical protein [uncultured Microbulbifer sp.]|uniref:hypothetical protein n=1 Tax=uncultured Microbulbifer sp. TaxID=348147 RepID=UPI0026260686|nr:hypothetical protein [uncultured Microbulbifer sp.]
MVETDFTKAYRNYIEEASALATSRIDPGEKSIKRETTLNEAQSLDICSHIHDLAMELSSDHAVIAVDNAVSKLDPSLQRQLLMELRFFNSLVEKTPEDVVTVSSSLEDLLKEFLPEWVVTRFKILLEILSLGKVA